ncbi:hypothetical protein LEMLEM_LOCUS22998 [Lemmus lemmus]
MWGTSWASAAVDTESPWSSSTADIGLPAVVHIKSSGDLVRGNTRLSSHFSIVPYGSASTNPAAGYSLASNPSGLLSPHSSVSKDHLTDSQASSLRDTLCRCPHVLFITDAPTQVRKPLSPCREAHRGEPWLALPFTDVVRGWARFQVGRRLGGSQASVCKPSLAQSLLHPPGTTGKR